MPDCMPVDRVHRDPRGSKHALNPAGHAPDGSHDIARYIRGSTHHGLGDCKHDVLRPLAAFPDMRTIVDDVNMNPDPDHAGGWRVAVRWTQLGTHEGPGLYGRPTGRRVRMMGITHHIIRDGLFTEEYAEWGEFATLQQLYAGSGTIPEDLLARVTPNQGDDA